MALDPGASLPAQAGRLGSLKAAYRLLNEEDATHPAVSSPHWEATRREARAPGLGAVLFVQDGTELDYTAHPGTSGLGFVGGGYGQGIELHTTLCVAPAREPRVLGMAFSHAWTRDHGPRKGNETRAQRDARHKETDVRGDPLEAVGRAPDAASGTRWVSVGDRGSDVFSFLTRARALGWGCLVRSKHDRRVEGPGGGPSRLHAFARSPTPVSGFSLSLRARPGKPARTVALRLAFSPLTLQPPAHTVGEPIPAWCVRVWEDPEGQAEPLEWILVSTDAVEGEEDALRLVEWYRLRWLVEEYHKCLKTGCRMESRQLSSRQGLTALLGFLGIVSVLLLQLKGRASLREVPEELKEALRALSQGPLQGREERDYLREIAVLGGFLGRKSDGEPGWQTVWRGWSRLQDIALGMAIARGERCG
jgi:hypothetical protein